MAKEYIEREAVVKELEEHLSYESPSFTKEQNECIDTGLKIARRIVKALPTADVVEVPKTGIGDLSDGYHTFNELYHHRAVLFAVLCNTYPHLAWKSKQHSGGDMYDGMFIVGIETREGQATYHYHIDPYWDMFHVKEMECAPAWDGHTPAEAIRRISTISSAPQWIPVTERLPEERDGDRKGRVFAVLRGEEPKIWHWSLVADYANNFTHWMQLPKPPEDGENTNTMDIS